MALETQYVQIALAEGIDTKTDPKLVQQTKLTVLENGKLAKTGTVQKRNGYEELSASISSSSPSTLTAGEALGVFKKEALVFNNGTVYARSNSIDAYVNRGSVNAVVVRERPVYSGGLTASSPDFDINGNVSVTAWVDSRGVVATVNDLETQSTFLAEVVLDSAATKCRVIALSSYIYVFYYSAASTTINWKRISATTPTAFSSATALPSSALDTGRILFDITNVDDNNAAYAYSRNGGGITFGTFNGALAVPTVVEDSASITENADNCLTVNVSAMNQNIWVAYFRSGTGVRAFIRSLVLVQILAPTTIDAQTQPSIGAITGEFSSESSVTYFYQQTATSTLTFGTADVNTTNDTILIAANNLIDGQEIKLTTSSGLPAPLVVGTSYYVINGGGSGGTSGLIKLASSDTNAINGVAIDLTTVGAGTQTLTVQQSLKRWTGLVKVNTLTQTGTVGTASTVLTGGELASKAFTYNGNIYSLVVYISVFQPTYFLIDSLGNVIAKIQTNKAGHFTSTGSVLPRVKTLSSGLFILPVTAQTTINTDTTDFFANLKVVMSEIDFGSDDRYFSAPIGNNLLIGGGYLTAYDGVNVVEAGFHVWPENVLGRTLTTGGSIAAGTYLYAFVYEWFDSYGQRHQSAPSIPVSITTTGTTSTNTFVVEVPRITLRKGSIQQARVIMYRTLVGGTIFYRVTSQASATNYTITNHTQRLIDTAADATISVNEVLYTSTGELENISPPACSLIATNKNRAFVVPSEDPTAIVYSKTNGTGPNAVGFSDLFVKRIDQIPGDIRAIETMDDKVVSFKQTNILFFAGDGPLNTGEQDTYSEVQLIASDDGTNEPTSIGASAEGIYFKAENKGIMRLNRNLQTEYVGREVEGFKDEKILSTDLLAKPYEVRFITDAGRALVYDTEQKQWSVYENHPAVDSLVWNGDYIYLTSTGKIFKEDETLTKDGNLAIPLVIETAWIKLSTIEGFQRVKSLMVLGDYISNHQLKISFAYDYQDYYTDLVYWDTNEFLAGFTYGDSTKTYGNSGVSYGGDSDGVYQVRAFVPNQKCESIKIRIEDISSGDLGKSMNITGLQLECKVKRGVFKLRQEKTAG